MWQQSVRVLGGALVVTVGLFIGACGQGPSESDDAAMLGEDAKGDSLSSTSTYYRFRHDFRRCISPVCGGYWVSRVNFATTKCVDGTWQSECYVPEIDQTALGTGAAVEAAFGTEGALLRGSIRAKTWGTFGNLGTFRATELWAPATQRPPTGTHYRVTDLDIRCVRAPCYALHQAKLNSTSARQLSDLDFRAVGASARQIAAARAALRAGGLISSGTNRTIAGATTYVMSQFYLRAVGAPDPLACRVSSDCVMSQYPRPVSSESDCYCARCPTTVMNRTTFDANQTSWAQHCSAEPQRCPAVLCRRPPEVACVNRQCVARTE